MIGMSGINGRAIDDSAHLQQSVRDILTTRVGARLARRDYGSIVPELIDQPANAANRLRLMAATVGAVARWEPRLHITRVHIDADVGGRVVIDMDAVRADGPRAGAAISMAVVV